MFKNFVNLRRVKRISHFTGRKFNYDVSKEVGIHKPPPEQAIWIHNIFAGGGIFSFFYTFTSKRFDVRNQEWVEKRIKDHFKKGRHTVTHITPVPKEGGCYVYFQDLEKAEKALRYVRAKPNFAYYMLAFHRTVVSHLVLGTPFIQDLVSKRPSRKLEILFPEKVETEEVFEIFRPYGRLSGIELDGQKVKILFWLEGNATCAKNCLHHSNYNNLGTIRINYAEFHRFEFIYNLFHSPRLLPVIAIVVLLLIYLSVEPLRLINVTQTILFNLSSHGAVPPVDFQKRMDDIIEINAEFQSKPDSVIILSGPKGVGKGTIIKNILNKRRLCLTIDCSKESNIVKPDANTFIDDLERSVGFYPTLSSLTSMISYIETFLPMKKQALTYTKVLQLNKVLSTIDRALSIISASTPQNSLVKFDYPVIVFDGFQDLIQELEKKSEGKAEDLKELLLQWAMNVTSQGKAHIVFVINDNAFKNQIFRDYPEYRATLKKIYVDDLSKEESVAYLTGKLQKLGIKNDINQERLHHHPLVAGNEELKSSNDSWTNNARTLFNIFTLNRFKKIDTEPSPNNDLSSDLDQKQDIALTDENFQQIVKSINTIGGRISDLYFLVERLQRGYSISDAVHSMVEESKRDILAEGFGGKLFKEPAGSNEWTQPQLWKSMKLIVQKQKVSYEELLYGPFEGDDGALDKLITSTDVLTMTKDGTVSAFSPLYYEAFKELTEDIGMIRGMEKACGKVEIERTQKKIDAIEDELVRIRKGGVNTTQIQERIDFLSEKIRQFNKILTTEDEKLLNLPKMKK
eukprot:gene8483-305_t